jgi:hypothetical protein
MQSIFLDKRRQEYINNKIYILYRKLLIRHRLYPGKDTPNFFFHPWIEFFYL